MQLVPFTRDRHGAVAHFKTRAVMSEINTESPASLEQKLNDENLDSEARFDAIKQLEQLASPDVIATLGNGLKNVKDAGIRKILVSTLERYDLIAAIPYFLAALNDADPVVKAAATYSLSSAIALLERQLTIGTETEQIEAKAHLQTIGAPVIGNILVELDQDIIPVTEERQRSAANALKVINPTQAIPYLKTILDNSSKPNLIISIISLLRDIGLPEVIDPIGRRLIGDANETIRRRSAQALQRLGSIEGRSYLCKAIINERKYEVRKAVADALIKLEGWEEKTEEIIRNLQESDFDRDELDALQIIAAINVPTLDEINEYSLTDFLIRKAVVYSLGSLENREDHRMTALLAKLIIASVGESVTLANFRLDKFLQKSNLTGHDVRLLRFEISPLLQAFQNDFQLPIARLNDETQVTWGKTIQEAQRGFVVRMRMSIAAFVVGIVLVVLSSWKVIFGNVEAAQLWGPGISFAGGITTMLLTIYSGPLKEIRRSVNDLGSANVAFIAYIHRVLQISHTFAYHYLNGKIEFEQMEKSSDLIEKAMNSTIDRLETQKDS